MGDGVGCKCLHKRSINPWRVLQLGPGPVPTHATRDMVMVRTWKGLLGDHLSYPAESPLQSSSSYYQLLRVDCSTAAFVSWRRSRAVMGSVIVININPRAQLSYEHLDPQSDVSKAQSRLI